MRCACVRASVSVRVRICIDGIVVWVCMSKLIVITIHKTNETANIHTEHCEMDFSFCLLRFVLVLSSSFSSFRCYCCPQIEYRMCQCVRLSVFVFIRCSNPWSTNLNSTVSRHCQLCAMHTREDLSTPATCCAFDGVMNELPRKGCETISF